MIDLANLGGGQMFSLKNGVFVGAVFLLCVFSAKAEEECGAYVDHASASYLSQPDSPSLFFVPEGAVPVIVVAGTPAERGAALGKYKGSDAKALISQFTSKMAGTLKPEFGLGQWNKMDSEVRDEITAFAAAAQIDLGDLIFANTFVDSIKNSMGCTTFIGETNTSSFGLAKNKDVFFSRNLDYKNLGILNRSQYILVVKSPPGKETHAAYASITWPGLFGVFTGMNEYGVTVSVNEIYSGNTYQGTPPYAFILRKVLEEAHDFKQAHDLLTASQFSTSIIISLADAKQFATIEVSAGNENGLLKTTFKDTEKMADFSYATNYFRSFIPSRSEKEKERDTYISGILATQQEITCKTHFDVLEKTKLPNLNLQSMIMIPRTREIYFRPGNARQFRRINLAKYF